MPAAAQTSSVFFLRFLDYFCILFVALLLNSAALTTARLAPLGASLAVFLGAWVLWRFIPSPATAVAVAAASTIVLAVGDNALSVMGLWLGFVALARSLGNTASRVFAIIPVVIIVALHLQAGSDPAKILIEFVAACVVSVAGVALGRTVNQIFASEKALRAANVRVRELTLAQERHRLATSLHDNLGHRLTIIAYGIDAVRRIMPTKPDAAAEELRTLRGHVSATLESMRTTVRAITPLELVDGDLTATCRQLAEWFRGTGVDITLESSLRTPPPEQVATLALVFVQEALTNVVRHAGADTAVITLSDTAVSVADDGSGNDTPPGFGITSLKERAEKIGGNVASEAHGGIDGGFRITLRFPVAGGAR